MIGDRPSANLPVTPLRHRRALQTASVGLVALPIGLHLLIGERPIDDVGPRALLDAAFALALAAVVLLIAIGLGQRILRLNAAKWSVLDRTVWAAPIGLGILAYGVLALGLLGWLQPVALGLWLVIAGGWAWREWLSWLREMRSTLSPVPPAWQAGNWARRLLVLAAALIFGLALLQALTPPYDYDGLMYHLQGPRLFLRAGRIIALPDNWQANGPAVLDTVFLMGLAWGSDTFAKVLHLACGLWLILATVSFGQRYLRPNGGWLAAAVLLGIPIYALWASWAYADMAWALFQFLSLYALIVWRDQRQRRWLWLGGVYAGLALGSKYLAIGNMVFWGLWVIWQSRSAGLKAMVKNSLAFGGLALLVGLPWYLKNEWLTGNPVFPLVFGGAGWDTIRLDWLMAFLLSFGQGRTLQDYILLPWNVYFQRANFTGFMGGIEWPSVLFPLAPLYALVRRNLHLNTVGWAVLFQWLWWAAGSQQTRFLLPLFPGLSLLVASLGVSLWQNRRFHRWKRALITGLVGAPVGCAVLIGLLFFTNSQPLPVIAGLESKDSFLRRMAGSYAAQRFIQSTLNPEARVLMMWDGRGYYCDARCLPDTEQSQWTRLSLAADGPTGLTRQLRALGITHLLYSPGDAEFVIQRDTTGRHALARQFFLDNYRGVCAREIHRDDAAAVYELTCG